MGDVLTLALSKPLEIAAHYDLTTMGIADGFVALPSSMAGVAVGALLAAYPAFQVHIFAGFAVMLVIGAGYRR